MPYLKPEERERLDAGEPPSCAGHLNYLITKMFVAYLQKMGTNYQNINDCIGAVEGAKMELYRVVAGPYEEVKVKENGGVYPSQLLVQPPPINLPDIVRPGRPGFVQTQFTGAGQVAAKATAAYAQAQQALTDK